MATYKYGLISVGKSASPRNLSSTFGADPTTFQIRYFDYSGDNVGQHTQLQMVCLENDNYEISFLLFASKIECFKGWFDLEFINFAEDA